MASLPRCFSLRYWLLGNACESPTLPPDTFGGPESGAWAPEFSLKTLEGRVVSLQDLRTPTPVVLVTGSYSCPSFRRSSRAIEELHSRYADRITFVILYTVEAHPYEGPNLYAFNGKRPAARNRGDGILIVQPQNYEERVKLAAQCRDALSLNSQIVIDDMDNRVWKAYGAAPNAAYLIDRDGKIIARHGWFHPPAVEQSIQRFLSSLAPKKMDA